MKKCWRFGNFPIGYSQLSSREATANTKRFLSILDAEFGIGR